MPFIGEISRRRAMVRNEKDPAGPDQFGPFCRAEHAIIAEVFAKYDFTPEQEKAAWSAIGLRWHETSGRFYTYNVACQIGAAITSNPV